LRIIAHNLPSTALLQYFCGKIVPDFVTLQLLLLVRNGERERYASLAEKSLSLGREKLAQIAEAGVAPLC
jgi:hypothetical protein